MRIKSNLKKVLSVVLAASVVTATSALAGLAAGGTQAADTETASGLNLMPMPGVTDWSGVSDMGNTASAGDGSYTFTLTADRVGTTDNAIVGVKMPINKVVNLKENPILYFDVEGDAAFNITVGYEQVDPDTDTVVNPDKYAQIGALYEGATNNYIAAGTKDSYNLYSYLSGRCYSDGTIKINYVTFALSGTAAQQAKVKNCYLAPESDGEWPAVPAPSVDVAATPVDLMPTSVDAINKGEATPIFTYEDGVLQLSCAADEPNGRASINWPVGKWVDINDLQEMNMKVKSENGGFGGLVWYNNTNPHPTQAWGMFNFVGDYAKEDTGFGAAPVNGFVPAGEYDADLEFASLAANQPCVKDTNGLVYLSSVILMVEAGGTVTLEDFSIPAPETPVNGVDMMPGDVSGITSDQLDATVELQNGSFVFKAGAADTTFTYSMNTPVDMTATQYIYFGLSATGGWDIKWASTALNSDVNPGISADFGNYFGKDNSTPETTYGTLIDAEEYGTVTPDDLKGLIDASGAYTWNDNLPADGIVAMKFVQVRVAAGAQVTLDSLYFSDAEGAAPVEPVGQDVLSYDPADWEYDSGVMQLTNGADGSLVYYNTNGLWPFATYRYDTLITFDPETTDLYYDFTVSAGVNGSFVLFLSDCTPDDFDGKDDRQFKLHRYIDGVTLEPGSGDLVGDGTPYRGVLDLSTVDFSDACYNDDGTITINAMRIFAAGMANTEITIREFSLIGEGVSTQPSETDPSETEPSDTDPSETDPSETEPSDTDPSETDPSETQPSATDSTASVTDTTATTAAPTTGNGGNNSPATGENTALAMVGSLLLIGSAGALILTKKKKA